LIDLIDFLRANAVVIVAISGLVTISGFMLLPLRHLFGRRRKPDRIEIVNPQALATAQAPAAPSQPVLTLTLEQFEDRLARREAEIRAELSQARIREHTLLKNELEELYRLKSDPEAAMEERRERMRDLDTRLQRESNEFGGAGLRAAQDALTRGDPSLADALFAEIEAQSERAVQASARAAFARGEIAEGGLRWADAARHYARAAELAPSIETLTKAHEFSWRSGDYPTAARLGEALAARARSQDDKTVLAEALNAHATTLNLIGRYEEAETYYREILELDRETIGTDTQTYSRHLSNLAHVYLVTGRFEEAEPLFREALKAAGTALGKAHPFYAQRLNNLGEVMRARHHYDEAEALYRRAIEIDAITVGRLHPSHSTHLNNLAETLMATGRDVEAEALLREAREIKAATLGKAHPYYAHVLTNLGVLYARLGRPDEAIAHLREAAQTRRRILGDTHPDTQRTLEQLEQVQLAGSG